MARSMPGRSIGRPAQGDNSTSPPKPTKAAYKPPFPTVRVISTGTQSKPKSGSGGKARYAPYPAPTRTVLR